MLFKAYETLLSTFFFDNCRIIYKFTLFLEKCRMFYMLHFDDLLGYI